MKFLLLQIKSFFTNPIGWILVFTNLLLAIWGIIEKGGDYSSFHFTYEPLSIKILSIVNIPIIVIAESISEMVYPPVGPQFSMVFINNFEMLLIVVFSIFQWLFIGYLYKFIFKDKLK